MLDIIIKNGLIIDGSGNPGYMSDLGVMGDRIVLSGELDTPAKRIIDAEGHVVSPGFIDIHSHTDHLVYVNQTCESKVTQGVTTELSGNCGESAAPRGGLHGSEDLCDWGPSHGVKPDWHTMSEYLAKLDHLPMMINSATLVGHGTIRAVAMGYEDREPTDGEFKEMCRLVDESLAAGAFGLSSGLVYPPGCYAETDELVGLCKIVAEYDGIYATHMRNENIKLLNAVDEAIQIGFRSGAGVQISHHKACGNTSKGKVIDSLAMIDDGRSHGLDIWADQYPYMATSTGLNSLLPNWAHDGGSEVLLKRVTNPAERRILREALLKDASPGGRIFDTGGWESIVVNFIYKESNKIYEGKNLAEIAKIMETDPIDAMLDLLLDEEFNVGIIHFMIDPNDVKTVMRHPAVLIGSDATARSRKGKLSGGKPHPRSYGTFPMVLGQYVRENNVLSLENAVAKMAGRTASRLGINNRGFIRDNYYADITVFNPDTVSDMATYADPHQTAKGISYVIVNGKIVIDNGEIADISMQSPGRVIRRGIE